MKEKLKQAMKAYTFAKNYYTRGMAVYVTQPLAIFAYTIVIYNFAYKNLAFIPEQFRRFYIFVPVVIVGLSVFGFIIGFFDYEKGTYQYEEKFKKKYSPMWKEITAMHDKIDLLLTDKQTLINKSFSEGVRVGEKRKCDACGLALSHGGKEL